MKPNAAIAYHPDGFDTSVTRLMGRQAAGEGFLEGLVRHGGVDRLYCFARGQQEFDDFTRRIGQASPDAPATQFIPESRPDLLKQPGCLFVSGPVLRQRAVQRATIGMNAFSLCGVTHTLSSTAVIDAIGDYLIAPLEPWDALVCTSSAARAVVDRVLDAEADYLSTRVGARPAPRLELPIIPLGVDCDRFAAGPHVAAARASWRAQLGIAEHDIAALFVGRLSFHAKANPAPMYLGLEAAVSALPPGARLHFILSGWFANPALERAFRDGARALCPSVNLIVVDGRTPEARTSLWHAADLFTSLSDNIQESFGLTPIEAMAAGLPSVVSDWDGYRDTIVHDETGFCVPTLMPPPGHGRDFAFRYANEIETYDRYIGGVALSTAVDMRATNAAYSRLIGDADLRRRMGEAGRKRARAIYDWRIVIAAYQDLWAELAARRSRADPKTVARAQSKHLSTRDPFALFAPHASTSVSLHHRVSWAKGAPANGHEALFTQSLANYAPNVILGIADCRKLAEAIRAESGHEIGQMIENFPAAQRMHAFRTLLWLAKFGLVEIDPPVERASTERVS